MKLKIACQIFLWRISQSEIRNSAATEKLESESEGGLKGRGLGGSLPTSRQGIFARPCLEPVRLWRIPILPSPPNFVFRFAKCAAKKKDVVFAPPTRARATDHCSLILFD